MKREKEEGGGRRRRVWSPEQTRGNISVAVHPEEGEGNVGILCLDQPGDPRWSHDRKVDAVGTYVYIWIYTQKWQNWVDTKKNRLNY